MSTRVFFVRHGATELSAEDRFSGSTDPPLSPEGQAQARAVSKRLAGETIAAVYCSPLQRAVQTASAIAAIHRLTPVHVPALREVDHGHWESLPQDEVKKQFADEYTRWHNDPFNNAPTNGETGLSVLSRSLPALRTIVHDHPDQTVVIVSHKATIRLLAASALGLDPRRYRDRLAQELACINIISFEGFERARLLLWNDIAHYAGFSQ